MIVPGGFLGWGEGVKGVEIVLKMTSHFSFICCVAVVVYSHETVKIRDHKFLLQTFSSSLAS